MQLDRAKEILKALADGVDPYTGERFPADGPYQRADTVRALYAALEAMESGKMTSRGEASERSRKPTDPNNLPAVASQRRREPRASAKWTPEEEQRLRDAFNARKPVPEIAAAHGRTPGAITARLVKLGLIEDNPTNRSGKGNIPNQSPSEDRPIPPTPLSEGDKYYLPF